jgi:hypothetical protein
MVSRVVFLAALVAVIAAFVPSASAFIAPRSVVSTRSAILTPTFMAKKKDVDLSDIEVRDMTREEMIDMNSKNEEIMNMELSMMTGFSLLISLPILYLCWVAFFSE